MEVEPTCEPPRARACEQVVRRRLHRGACGAADVEGAVSWGRRLGVAPWPDRMNLRNVDD